MQGSCASSESSLRGKIHAAAWLLAPLLLLAAAAAQATQPQRDTLQVGDQSGWFQPEECCWVELPRTERLIAAKRAERCSAIGGPVGRFQLWDNHVWLIGLRRCGDARMPLEEIYPEMTGPTPANWLNGRFTAKLDRLCLKEGGVVPVFRTVHQLEIEQGRVVDMQTQTHDGSECHPPLADAPPAAVD